MTFKIHDYHNAKCSQSFFSFSFTALITCMPEAQVEDIQNFDFNPNPLNNRQKISDVVEPPELGESSNTSTNPTVVVSGTIIKRKRRKKKNCTEIETDADEIGRVESPGNIKTKSKVCYSKSNFL